MLDPTATYRCAQVATANPVTRIVLLYQGAIRFASQHLAFLERSDIEQAHRSSLRAQEIVSALQESLDMSAGPIASQLDELYTFVLRRLIDGNIGKTARPTEEAIQVLRELLEAWQAIASGAADAAPRLTVVPASGPYAYPEPRVLAGGMR